MNKFIGYDSATENRMRIFYCLLAEDSRRRYAAIEAMKIGYGGASYVARVLGCAQSTVHIGIQEIKTLEAKNSDEWEPPAGSGRVRRPGGGRHKKLHGESGEELVSRFKEVTKSHIAGSPTDHKVTWIGLKPFQIAISMTQKGCDVSPYIVEQILEDSGYRKRGLCKELITGEIDPVRRNWQFEHIAALKEQYLGDGLPVLSVDTKKKELIGPFFRRGGSYSTDPQIVYDHDYPHLAIGKGVPHGIYDVGKNFGFMTIGTSAETSEFVTDSIARWYHLCGRHWYPEADEMLLLFDAGGANGINSTRFKEDMINLSARIKKKIRVAHYPPYTSKWNPIEHRLFSHVERSLGGIALSSVQRIRDAVARTTTTTGLRVKAYISQKVYELGRKCSAYYDELKNFYITENREEGNWNYIVDARLLVPLT